MASRVLTKIHTGYKRIFRGQIPEEHLNKIKSYQDKMDLFVDEIKLKRQISESISNINSYPF